jgi:hypothetical protein
MSKFATSFDHTLTVVLKPYFYRNAVLYENTDGTWNWKAKDQDYPTLGEAIRAVDAAYDFIANSIRIAKS